MHKALIFVCLLGLFSCDENRVFDRYKNLPGQWDKDSLIDFSFEAPDTLQQYNLFINLRNDSNYPYQNLFLITQMQFPNGKVIEDTLEYEMAKPTGEWLGTGFGELKESKLWYKEKMLFSESGTYKIKIRQALRKNGSVQPVQELEGITEVGFRIENIEN